MNAVQVIVGGYGGGGLIGVAVRPDGLVVGEAIADAPDASHGVWSARHGTLYVVTERKAGEVRALRRAGGRLAERSRASSGGAAPCHLALSPDERWLAAANYESGTVALFRLAEDGALPARPTAQHQLAGRGPNAERQEGPHAHWVGFGGDGTRLRCVDLGSDRIHGFDVTGGTLDRPTAAYRAPPGSGPRQLAFHPTRPLAFLLSELASTLTVLAVGRDGRMVPIGSVSTLPAGAGDSIGGGIAVNAAGTRVYVTNRGHDSVATFAVTDHGVTLLGHVASGGASPRFVLILEDARRLLVAHEQSGTVTLFAIRPGGELEPVGAPAAVPGSAWIAPLPG